MPQRILVCSVTWSGLGLIRVVKSTIIIVFDIYKVIFLTRCRGERETKLSRNCKKWRCLWRCEGKTRACVILYMAEWCYVAWLSNFNLARVKTDEEPLLRIKENMWKSNWSNCAFFPVQVKWSTQCCEIEAQFVWMRYEETFETDCKGCKVPSLRFGWKLGGGRVCVQTSLSGRESWWVMLIWWFRGINYGKKGMSICSSGRVCWHVQQCWCCSAAPQMVGSRWLKLPALHPCPLCKHPYTQVSEFLSCLWLQSCPQSSTPRYLQDLPFLWPELGLSSWLSQWPTSGTFPCFDVLEVSCQGLLQFLAASIAKFQVCATPFFRYSTLLSTFFVCLFRERRQNSSTPCAGGLQKGRWGFQSCFHLPRRTVFQSIMKILLQWISQIGHLVIPGVML